MTGECRAVLVLLEEVTANVKVYSIFFYYVGYVTLLEMAKKKISKHKIDTYLDNT